jgi:outer membrane scaffolding protein for murein synthesis (MipA/OmpV family)
LIDRVAARRCLAGAMASCVFIAQIAVAQDTTVRASAQPTAAFAPSDAASAPEPAASAPESAASAPESAASAPEPAASAPEPAAAASAPAAAASAPDGAASAPAKPWRFEGALGPVVNFSPDYSGSNVRKISVVLGYYLRYGRLSISNTGGFVTRREKDDIFRGLGLDLKSDERLRLNVALRIDNGRKANDVHGLEGLDDVKRTIRARFSATRYLDEGWKAIAGLSSDLLGKGGGNILDIGATHDHRWSPSTTWSVNGTVTAGDLRYMRSWYGISEDASARSGKPVYEPGAGLRDASLSGGFRTEIEDKWIVLGGASVSRLLGPAAKSPLTLSKTQWGLSFGVARRF